MRTLINLARHTSLSLGAALLISCAPQAVLAADAAFTDVLRLGDPTSEAAHKLTATDSQIIDGALGQKARILLPRPEKNWKGGEIHFTLTVDPKQQNYLSLRLFGSDVTPNQLTLVCDGKQLGYRHISDIDLLDKGSKAPMKPGQFYYATQPLPLQLTKGRDRLDCYTFGSGPIFGYASKFEQFQKLMETPSRGIYALYVHADKFMPLQGDEGAAPPPPPVNATPIEPSLEKIKVRINKQVTDIFANKARSPNQMEIIFLAKAYGVKWTKAYKNTEALNKIIQGLDGLYEKFKVNPEIAHVDPATPNPDWWGMGLSGEALKLTAPLLQKELDSTLPDANSTPVSRREAYAKIFAESRDWNSRFRRLYTNQTMIKDLYGIWYDNEGLIALNSPLAKPRESLLPFLYEAVGLKPWSGSLNDKGEPTYAASEADAKFSVGKNYLEITDAGLTKELGYVGGYGEVLDLVAAIYDATKPSPDKPGDQKIYAQLVKMAKARSYFRYPTTDDAGNRAMRLEGVVSWRDSSFPGDVVYGERPGRDSGTGLSSTFSSGHPAMIGFAQQMLQDNQIGNALDRMMKETFLRTTIGLMPAIEEIEKLRSLPKQPFRLPMSEGAPDIVFSDPEDAVVAIKNGKDILYASLYWRANYGVNRLAKIHHITPQTDRTAFVYNDRVEFEAGPETFTRGNTTHNTGHRFYVKYPEELPPALGGEVLPVAKLPEGVKYMAGEDNPFAGRCDYYELHYGPYIIAINASKDKTFALNVPPSKGVIRELVKKRTLSTSDTVISLAPQATTVLYYEPTK